MVIVCDIDDTINNLQEVVVSTFNKRYHTKYTINDFENYDIERALNKHDAENMKVIYSEPGIYDNVRPEPGSQDALRKLIQEGHDVYLVTDAIPSIYAEKVEWVKHHFPFVDPGKIVCMKDKWLIECDLIIEDRIETLLAKPYYYRACIDRPWNRSVHDYVYEINRIKNWNDIFKVIDDIYELEE